jgi:hypothetical protein
MEKIRSKDILIETNFQGGLVLSYVCEGRRLHRVYMGYSKAYAIKHFKSNLP